MGSIATSDRVDEYVAKKGFVPLLTEEDWEAFVSQVLSLYGRELWHRSRRITQRDELFQRYSTTFPDGLAKPYRHIRSVELLVLDSLHLDNLRRWLTLRGIKFELIEDTDKNDLGEITGLRVLGFEPAPGSVA